MVPVVRRLVCSEPLRHACLYIKTVGHQAESVNEKMDWVTVLTVGNSLQVTEEHIRWGAGMSSGILEKAFL